MMRLAGILAATLMIAGCGGGGGGFVAERGIASLASSIVVSPGAAIVEFHPVVPITTAEVRCEAHLIGGARGTATIDGAAMSRVPGGVRGRAHVRLPVPEGESGNRGIACSVTWDTTDGQQTETLTLYAHIERQRPAPASEVRAAWTHLDAIEDPDDLFGRMAAGGLNTVFIRARRGETAHYDSEAGPLSVLPFGRADQLERCLASARAHGLEPHVYVNCLIIGQPDSIFARELRRENRWQRKPSGDVVAWLCPSVPENVAIVRAGMMELVRDYDIAGIQYDFIRYPDEMACFCSNCRAAFEARTGQSVRPWPNAVTGSGTLVEDYRQFREEQISAIVRDISSRIRALRPDVTISAAVYRQPWQARVTRGQDWPSWCAEGLVDAVCPMDYTLDAHEFEDLATAALQVAGPAQVWPGIGAATMKFGMDYPEQLAAQINVTRRLGAGGFTLFAIIPPTDVPETLLGPIRDTVLIGDGRP